MTLKEQIFQLKSSGISQAEIAKTLGCTSGTVSYHCSERVRDNIRNKRRVRRMLSKTPFVHSLLDKEIPIPIIGSIDWKYAEAFCISKLVLNGYDVFIPINGGGEIDCIAVKDSKSYNVQIKSSAPVKDRVVFALMRNSVNFHHGSSKPYTCIDFFLLFDGVNVFKLDFDENIKGIAFRYKVTSNNQVDKINMASDYLF